MRQAVRRGTSKEGWNINRLADGSRIKVRLLVGDIIMTKDEISKGVALARTVA